jgi:hypothetical protein
MRARADVRARMRGRRPGSRRHVAYRGAQSTAKQMWEIDVITCQLANSNGTRGGFCHNVLNAKGPLLKVFGFKTHGRLPVKTPQPAC